MLRSRLTPRRITLQRTLTAGCAVAALLTVAPASAQATGKVSLQDFHFVVQN